MELLNALSEMPLPVLVAVLLVFAVITIVITYQYAKMKGFDGIRQDVYCISANLESRAHLQ